MDDEVITTCLSIESHGLGRWEVAASLEDGVGLHGVTTLLLVRDANWLIVVLLNLVGSGLEIWGEHSGLKSATSGDAVGRVESTGWVLLEDLLDLSDAAWDTGGFSNQFDAVDLLVGQTCKK